MHVRAQPEFAMRTLALLVASLAFGIAVWLALAWALAVFADHTSSAAAERVMAAMSPQTFGPFVALVAAALIFLVVRRHARPQ